MEAPNFTAGKKMSLEGQAKVKWGVTEPRIFLKKCFVTSKNFNLQPLTNRSVFRSSIKVNHGGNLSISNISSRNFGRATSNPWPPTEASLFKYILHFYNISNIFLRFSWLVSRVLWFRAFFLTLKREMKFFFYCTIEFLRSIDF